MAAVARLQWQLAKPVFPPAGVGVFGSTRSAGVPGREDGQNRAKERDERPGKQADAGARAVAARTGQDHEERARMYQRRGGGDAGNGVNDQIQQWTSSWQHR